MVARLARRAAGSLAVVTELAPPPSAGPTLLVTLTGPDHPGVSAALFAAVREDDLLVLDVEQVVVRGRLTLAVLLQAGDQPDQTAADLARAGAALGMQVSCQSGLGDNAPRRSGRLHVTVLGAPLRARGIQAVAEAIAEHGGNIDRIRRISRWPVTTVEIDVSGAEVGVLRRGLSALAAAHGLDIAVAPAGLARRGRRLVVLDVDSTLIQDEVIELIADHAGRASEVAVVTDRAMRGELDFAASLHERVALLAGLPVSVLDQVRGQVRLTPGARTLVRTLQRLGFTVALVSGGFAEIVRPLADLLDIEHIAANALEVRDGRLTGRVVGPVLDRPGKAAALRRFAAAEGVPLSRTVAIGDGANDLDMLDAAGLGIAFNAKPVVRERADTSVTVPYLDAVLYLLGIPREEIEEADAADGLRQDRPSMT